jgi:hypothetical protein
VSSDVEPASDLVVDMLQGVLLYMGTSFRSTNDESPAVASEFELEYSSSFKGSMSYLFPSV